MRKRIVLIALVASLVVLAGAAIAVSLLVNIDSFRPQLARAMTAAVGRDVAIGHISLSLLSGSAVVEDLSIADDPAFSPTPFVTAKAVRVGIAVLPLLTSRHLQVESLRLHAPRVALRRSAAGTWNFATFGAASAAPQGDGRASSGLTLSIDRLTVDGGEVAVETSRAQNSRHVYKDFAVDVHDLSATTPFRFATGVATPGGGHLQLDGQAGPFTASGIGAMPIDATLDVTNVDVTRAGLVDAGAGLSGVVTAKLRVVSNDTRINASGTLRADKVQLVAGATAATRPVEISFVSDYDVVTHDGVVKRGDLHVGDAAARLLGRFSTRGVTPTILLTLTGQHMPVKDLQALLPAVGATLPRGASFSSGVVDVNLTASGPIDRLVTAGPVAMSDATLSGFDLGSRMQAVALLTGSPQTAATTIQTLAVTLRVAPDGIRASELRCVVQALGQIEGSGTIAPGGALDFNMLAKLAHTNGLTASIARVASLGNPESGIPFKITGTTASPLFVPDVARAAAGAVTSGGVSRAAGIVRSWFGKKKP